MKERLDTLLVARGLTESREKARALIMEGAVLVNGIKAQKAGEQVQDTAEITVKENALPFVSRGGLKLQKALEVFPIDLTGRICADVGASTGGFTDCMLQHGASHVYSLDVGYGQLHWKLRNDPRVTVLERKNARFMEPDWFDAAPSFGSIDVSFISLKLILPPLFQCLTEGGEVVALIKPQFEAGRNEIGKNGVVRDRKIHSRVIADTIRMAKEIGFCVCSLDYSPITGPKGNIEFLLYLKKQPEDMGISHDEMEEIIENVVSAAHDNCI
ncbi:MAG: TlyA family RNA methyltransferase [Clostridia bacterium]|nr:TlyA family RNA methyltransferase [Clostridia bacterium]